MEELYFQAGDIIFAISDDRYGLLNCPFITKGWNLASIEYLSRPEVQALLLEIFAYIFSGIKSWQSITEDKITQSVQHGGLFVFVFQW